jgi:VanZ family protein
LLNFQMIFGLDKLMHFIGFLGASTLIGIFILITSGPDNVKHKLKVVWFSMVTIGIIEEYRQLLEAGRSAEFLDAVANIAGVSMGIGVTLGLAYLVVVLMMFLLGLLYLNERPFMKMDVSFQEHVRSLAALIGF